MENGLQKSLQTICEISAQSGVCSTHGTLHKMTPAVQQQLTELCQKQGQSLTPEQVKDTFITLNTLRSQMVDCSAPADQYPVRGNIFPELDKIVRDLAFYGSFHQIKEVSHAKILSPTISPTTHPPEPQYGTKVATPLNLFKGRETAIKDRRTTTPIGLERATELPCWYNTAIRGTQTGELLCGTHGSTPYTLRGDVYKYEGTFDFREETAPKLHKVKDTFAPMLMENKDHAMQFLHCLVDQLGALPEFHECRDFMGKTFSDVCESADHIFRSLSPSSLAEKYAAAIRESKKEIQLWEELLAAHPERQDIANKVVDKEAQVRLWENFLKDPRARETKWNAIRSHSIDRGFFFIDEGLGISDKNTIDYKGVVITPVHELLPDEMNRIRQFASEAIYVCTPPEYRLGKRPLEFFKDEGLPKPK